MNKLRLLKNGVILYESSEDSANLPQIIKIDTDKIYNDVSYPILFRLDKPAPEDFYIQLHRRSKHYRRHNSHQFRPIDIPQGGGFLVPQGATTLPLTGQQANSLFRPTKVRGDKYREWDNPNNYSWVKSWDANSELPNGIRHNPLCGRYYNYVLYKFGTCRWEKGVSFRKGAVFEGSILKILKYQQSGDTIVRTKWEFI